MGCRGGTKSDEAGEIMYSQFTEVSVGCVEAVGKYHLKQPPLPFCRHFVGANHLDDIDSVLVILF